MHIVIKNQQGKYIAPGNFISLTHTEQGWHYISFDNINQTGFVFYSNEKTARKELEILQRLGYDFMLDYINI